MFPVSAMNRKEAAAIAETVIRHYRTHPEISLGVGTFSSAQQNAVLQEVEAKRQQHPELDEYFSRDHNEHFFVKNLETIHEKSNGNRTTECSWA